MSKPSLVRRFFFWDLAAPDSHQTGTVKYPVPGNDRFHLFYLCRRRA